jgi:Flp pilus assembly pilin Flp
MTGCHVLALLRRLRRDRSGATAVEFGFIAPAFFIVVWGTIELGMVLFTTSALEGSVREAARAGLTGYTPNGMNRETFIRNVVQNYTFGMIDMDKLKVTTLVYSSFANVGQPEPFTDGNGDGQHGGGESFVDVNGNGQWDADMGVAGLGGPGDIVLYTLEYDWIFLAGYANTIFGVPGIKLKTSVAIRNEPF